MGKDPGHWEQTSSIILSTDLADRDIDHDELPEEYKTACRGLLRFALERCDCLCGTPVGLAEVQDQLDVKFDFIIIDEAARLTENLALLPLTRWPQAPCIFLGDPKQFGPMAIARDDRQFRDIFGLQRATSLLARVELANVVDVHLTENFRTCSQAIDSPKELFYPRMELQNLRLDSELVKEFRHWAREAFHSPSCQGDVYFLENPYSVQKRRGSSYANVVNARFGRELVVFLYQTAPLRSTSDFLANNAPGQVGTVLIIVGYSAQKAQWQRAMMELCPAELPLSKIEVRTIDDSQSHEADIVIVDLTRTEGEGFLAESQRMAVMTTRARLATFVLGRKDAIKNHSHLGQFYRHIAKRSASIELPKGFDLDWTRWCTKCCQHGHVQNSCAAKPKCSICVGKLDGSVKVDHAMRRCPHAETAPFPLEYGVESRASDGVKRNPLGPCKPVYTVEALAQLRLG